MRCVVAAFRKAAAFLGRLTVQVTFLQAQAERLERAAAEARSALEQQRTMHDRALKDAAKKVRPCAFAATLQRFALSRGALTQLIACRTCC
jgi:hypothetical protein